MSRKGGTYQRWKARIIYSFIGRASIASTYDVPDDDDTSIVHFKSKAVSLFNCYRDLYPEVSEWLPQNGEDLADEIYRIYLNAGTLYHKPNRIVSAAPGDGSIKGITFTRGYGLEEVQYISGLGTYIDREISSKTAEEFLFADERNLKEIWEECLDKAEWSEQKKEDNVEYLRMTGSFSAGYWTNRPDNKDRISIMRTGIKGSQLYYLYKLKGGKLYVSQLPQWIVDNSEIRTITNACLNAYTLLPAIKTQIDGDIVLISFNYLPPLAELGIWKLYTWPGRMTSFPEDFFRICDKRVYTAIKQIMQCRGYNFIEE